MDELLTDRATIQRGTEAVSASGEVTKTYTSLATSVPCSIQPRSGRHRMADYGRDDASSHAGFFRSIQDIKTGDRVVSGSSTYLVTFVGSFGSFAPHKEVDLQLVQAP